jgi:hypothetical protein
MTGVGILSLTRKVMSFSNNSINPKLSVEATSSLLVGLLVTQPCFFDEENTNTPATKTAMPECDLESSWVANAASI